MENTMQIVQGVDSKYIAIGPVSREDADKLRQAGFKWNSIVKNSWATPDPTAAASVASYIAGAVTKASIATKISEWEDSMVASRATCIEEVPKKIALRADFIRIPEGKELLPHQKAGIAFMLSRTSTLCADEMGLGKTIEAIVAMNDWFLSGLVTSALVICPASLKLNWEKEIKEWMTYKATVQVVNAGDTVSMLPKTDILIINYDLLKKWAYVTGKKWWGLVIADESHMIKNPSAQRTKYVTQLHCNRRIALTGTPMPNSPKELWSVASWLRKDIFYNQWYFYNEYCYVRREFGRTVIDGGKNLPRLQKKMRSTFLVRRKKEDVLKDLPDKTRQIIEIPHEYKVLVEEEKTQYANMTSAREKMKQARKDILDNAVRKEKMEELMVEYRVAFGKLAIVRKELAMKKVSLCIEHIENVLDSVGCLVLFTYHKEPAYTIASHFKGRCGVITGDTPLDERNSIVQKFQNGDIDLVIGTIGAMGTGLTLTRSSNVVMMELDWTPANLEQAEDRCHRIGQKNAVLVQYLVLHNSLDANMMNKVCRKGKLIKETLE